MAVSDYRAIFNSSANAYMVLDTQLQYVDANPAYLALTGSRLEDLLGRHVISAFPHDPDDPHNENARMLRDSLERVLRTGQPDFLAYIAYRVRRTPAGPLELREWSATHTPVFDADGNVTHVLQHTVEVTDLKKSGDRAELLQRAQNVQQSNIRLGHELDSLRELFAQAPGFMCFLRGPGHVFEIANDGYMQLVGRRQLIGKTVREALPDVAGQGFYELLDGVFTSGEPFVGRGVKATITRPGESASERLLDFVYQAILGPDGTALGVLVQGHDVTEQLRTQVRQRFSARASEVLATTSDLDAALKQMAVEAVDGFCDWCLVDLFDHEESRRIAAAHADPSLAALAERAYAFPLPPRDNASHPQLGSGDAQPHMFDVPDDSALLRLSRGTEHVAWARELHLRGGIVVPLTARGVRYGVVSFLVTHSRRFSAADLTTAEDLARLASSVIDNAQLLAREQAANRAKDDFLAMLGHELRNPLSPIVTAVQLMKLRGETGSAREQAIIERQAQHLVRLVDDLLDVSRMSRGKIDLDKKPFDMTSAITRALEIAGSVIEQRQHRLHLDVQGPLPVDGDEVRLSQAISNLLSNAARYTNPGGDVWVNAKREGDDIVVRVKDNGLGIAPDMLSRIFEMFVQGPRRPDKSQGGLGLGLTIVRTLVELHGGSVSAYSAGLDEGSELTIRIPAGRAVVEAAAPLLAPGKQRILVVDDNVDAAQLLAEILELQGYTTRQAHDGPSALVAASQFKPQIALLDIGLPVMDGYELAAHLRKRLGGNAPHMIALTGYGQAHDHQRSMDAGFHAHLVKPVDATALLGILQRLTAAA